MAKQQFKAQADICKKSLDALHKAIELDPDNAEEYEVGIAYTENVMKASNAIVKAFDVVEPPKTATPKEKSEDTPKEEKPKRKRKRKAKSSEPPIPVVEEAEEVIAPVTEEDADLFAMFGD